MAEGEGDMFDCRKNKREEGWLSNKILASRTEIFLPLVLSEKGFPAGKQGIWQLCTGLGWVNRAKGSASCFKGFL